jgi:hypothetical protein
VQHGHELANQRGNRHDRERHRYREQQGFLAQGSKR